MTILEKIKEECKMVTVEHGGWCSNCKLYGMCPSKEYPENWNIKEIEKRLADGTKGEK